MKSAVFAQYNQFGGNVFMCYGYVHLDNLSDISAYRNHNVQCEMQIPKDTYGLKSCLLFALRKSLYQYISVIV